IPAGGTGAAAPNLGAGMAPAHEPQVGHEHPTHGHAAHVAHHFDDPVQQHEAATLGMWAFLATEVLFFGALFTAYAVYRHYYFEEFVLASKHFLLWWLGGINTAVLLCSSLTVVLAVHAAQNGEQKKLIRFLVATVMLGAAFLGIKATEYTIDYHEGLIPGRFFHPELSAQEIEDIVHEKQAHNRALEAEAIRRGIRPHLEMFMGFYFVLTGIHASHMIVGIGIFSWLIWGARRGKFSREYSNPVEIGGLYWHFV